MNQGWKCPECHTVYAPFVRECKCSKKKSNVYAISVNTKVELDNIKVDLHPKDIIVNVVEEVKFYKLNSNNYWTEYHPSKQVILLTINI